MVLTCTISAPNSKGAVIVSHLFYSSLVRITAKLLIGLLLERRFLRELDPATDYPELRINQRDRALHGKTAPIYVKSPCPPESRRWKK